MISKIYRIPGRSIVSRSLITTQQSVTTNRFYSSYRNNDPNSNGSSSNSSNKDNDQTNQVPTTQQQKQPTEQDAVVREQLSFMPVVNMPEAEFAHNAFFSLHRPLLGLSSDEERPFFTSTTTSRQHQHQHGPNKIQKMLGLEQPKDEEAAFNAEDEELSQYLMNLRPFEPPQTFDGKDSTTSTNNMSAEDDETVVTLSFDDGHSAYDEIEAIHMDQSMPIFYMPDSDEVVDYLTAMQDKIQQRQQREKKNHVDTTI
ncbi:hypothetical protein BDC45DRAFT_339030 [Circinella umbellata]|nr:hypothetical protein BDC45DRAFT_339030 [Circinella umbellata]